MNVGGSDALVSWGNVMDILFICKINELRTSWVKIRSIKVLKKFPIS